MTSKPPKSINRPIYQPEEELELAIEEKLPDHAKPYEDKKQLISTNNYVQNDA